MSATGRSDVRDPDDFYETPAWCTDLILPHLTTLPSVVMPRTGTATSARHCAYSASIAP